MRKQFHSLTLRLLAVLTLAVCAPAVTYAQPARGDATGWQFSVGAGLMQSPNYKGDDARQVLLVPSISASHGQHWAISFRQGVQYTVNPHQSWRWGVAVLPFLGRDSDGSSPFRISGNGTDDLLGLDDIDTTLGLKLFTEYKLAAWSFKAQAQQSASSDSRGLLTFGLSRSSVLKTKGPPLIVSGGFNLRLGNRQSMQSLVGVTPEQSTALGLAAYSPDAGIIEYGVSGRAILPLTRSLSLMGILSIDQLSDEITASSLNSERGESLQVSTGLFLTYRMK